MATTDCISYPDADIPRPPSPLITPPPPRHTNCKPTAIMGRARGCQPWRPLSGLALVLHALRLATNALGVVVEPALEIDAIFDGEHCEFTDGGRCVTDGPDNYGNGEQCLMRMTGNAGVVSSRGTFRMESGAVGWEEPCQYDFLEIVPRGT